jgi:prepilin-type N-terminal cleavage/methylation domain-containing protein
MYKNGSSHGFTLVELMVVLVIMGILATGIIMMFTDPTGKVKVEAFELRGDINLARAVAVKENEDVLIQFVMTADDPVDPADACSQDAKATFDACFSGGNRQGYVICFDEDDDNDCQDEVRTSPPATAAEVAEDLQNNIIKTVLFHKSIQFYDIGATAPANGPSGDPLGKSLLSDNGLSLEDETATQHDFLNVSANGMCDNEGSAVIYYPQPGSIKIKGRPYAVVVNNRATSRTIIERWRDDLGAWSRK